MSVTACSPSARTHPDPLTTWTYSLTTWGRILYVASVAVIFYNHVCLQVYVDWLWGVLLTSQCFTTVYFETLWTILCYIPVQAVVFSFDQTRVLDKFKINPSTTWQHVGIKNCVYQALEYATPLMILDTFTVKKYSGVEPVQWDTRRQNLIQHTRALPLEPPTIGNIFYQLGVSLILYDVMFCLIHYIIHQNRCLYKYLHAEHHNHGHHIVGSLTNKLTIVERVMLVLSANEALKLVHSHPLTRAVFVPVFEWWLTDNHSGYDFPWSLDKIVPFGLVSGSRRHWEHHVHGVKYYAPFFTYMDKLLLKIKKS